MSDIHDNLGRDEAIRLISLDVASRSLPTVDSSVEKLLEDARCIENYIKGKGSNDG